jgi:signal transduction histidine kinase
LYRLQETILRSICFGADKNRINQVITNLPSNAIKFTDEGTVSVTAVPNTNEIVVSITDTGPGIDYSRNLPQNLERVMDLVSQYQKA